MSTDELTARVEDLTRILSALITSAATAPVGALLTADELSDRFRIPARTLRDMASAGLIPHHRLGKHYRFAADDITDILRITRQQPVSRHARARLATAA
ncbi:helix-turn-helix domain-containing protein [Embleya hyalina]|uniref:Helix-turn-helix domain-containing protein n=1 Tax=Embleya hyalina TaxID=516124 RepID=A0A401YUQ5_9ACTN|nr:helix-turn-helix domain-containing protein [Embleya hyalina]GCD98342.1 hypothetical protein EHYA_06048 [Embleya hyalina]